MLSGPPLLQKGRLDCGPAHKSPRKDQGGQMTGKTTEEVWGTMNKAPKRYKLPKSSRPQQKQVTLAKVG